MPKTLHLFVLFEGYSPHGWVDDGVLPVRFYRLVSGQTNIDENGVKYLDIIDCTVFPVPRLYVARHTIVELMRLCIGMIPNDCIDLVIKEERVEGDWRVDIHRIRKLWLRKTEGIIAW